MKEGILAARGAISDIAGKAVFETFNTMFGENISENERQALASPENVVLSCITLKQGDTVVDFCFKFDMDLLLRAAKKLFGEEATKSSPPHHDLACEVANIVCSSVKSYLNNQGYEMEMQFPFIPDEAKKRELLEEQLVHMHFFFTNSEGYRTVGVAVNFTVS